MLGVAGVGFQRLRSRSAASPMLSIVREIARGALLGQVGGAVGVGDIVFFFLFWGWVGEEKRRGGYEGGDVYMCLFLCCVAIMVFLERCCSSRLLLCDYVVKVSWFVRS